VKLNNEKREKRYEKIRNITEIDGDKLNKSIACFHKITYFL
jgi:hypothetical protein